MPIHPDWSKLFGEQWPNAPVSEADIEQLQSALNPLSDVEIEESNRRHREAIPQNDPLYTTSREFDAGRWTLPNKPFPSSYLSFLRWSNGGEFTNGARQFAPLFASSEIREMMLAYEVPEYLPGAVPIGFDGGGTFYLFDMRAEPRDGEYPIVFCGSGALDWEIAIRIAETFPEFCAGTTDPYDD